MCSREVSDDEAKELDKCVAFVFEMTDDDVMMRYADDRRHEMINKIVKRWHVWDLKGALTICIFFLQKERKMVRVLGRF